MSTVPVIQSNLKCKDFTQLLKQTSKQLRAHGITSLDKCVGQGEFGTTFAITGENRVVKIIKLPTAKSQHAFDAEAGMQMAFGSLGVGPTIFDAWRTDKFGFIVMEKLQYIYRALFYDFADNDNQNLDEVRMLWWADQNTGMLSRTKLPYLDRDIERAIIGAVEVMIANGFFHNDLHPDNIGMNTEGQIRLFDYGLTTQLQQSCVRDGCYSDAVKLQCLGFTLYQIIEHLPLFVRDMFSQVYDVIYLIRRNEYVFGSNVEHFQTFRMDTTSIRPMTQKLLAIQRNNSRSRSRSPRTRASRVSQDSPQTRVRNMRSPKKSIKSRQTYRR